MINRWDPVSYAASRKLDELYLNHIIDSCYYDNQKIVIDIRGLFKAQNQLNSIQFDGFTRTNVETDYFMERVSATFRRDEK